MSSWVSRSVLSVVLLGAWPAAQACDVGGQKVGEVMSAHVATYDDKGDFAAEIGKEKIAVDAPIVECKDSPSLVKVKTTDGAEFKLGIDAANLSSSKDNVVGDKVFKTCSRCCEPVSPLHHERDLEIALFRGGNLAGYIGIDVDQCNLGVRHDCA